jgi:tyrosine-protein phosphatase SIW14
MGLITWGAIALNGWRHRQAALNVSEVQAGVLYRSGQPQGKALEDLRDLYHFRTVINLREVEADDAWRAEEAFCHANGIRCVPMQLGVAVTDQQQAEFLKIVQDPACQPVLVHCEMGRVRTGYMVAYYRMVVQHWSYETAAAEAQVYGFPGHAQKYDEQLRSLGAAVQAP